VVFVRCKLLGRGSAHALRWRVGRAKLGVAVFEIDELVQQRVVVGVRNLRIVQYV